MPAVAPRKPGDVRSRYVDTLSARWVLALSSNDCMPCLMLNGQLDAS